MISKIQHRTGSAIKLHRNQRKLAGLCNESKVSVSTYTIGHFQTKFLPQCECGNTSTHISGRNTKPTDSGISGETNRDIPQAKLTETSEEIQNQ